MAPSKAPSLRVRTAHHLLVYSFNNHMWHASARPRCLLADVQFIREEAVRIWRQGVKEKGPLHSFIHSFIY